MIAGTDPASLLQMAVASANIELINTVMGLYKEYRIEQARTAFNNSMSIFLAELPEIVKRGLADFKAGNSQVTYQYAELSDIMEAIKPGCLKHGISISWPEPEEFYDAKGVEKVRVTCNVSKGAYTQKASLSFGMDQTGSKNALQAKGSTISYLMRYTVSLALGIVTSKGTDGQLPGSNEMTREDLGILISSTESKKELNELYAKLPAKFKNDADVKAALKAREAFFKQQTPQ